MTDNQRAIAQSFLTDHFDDDVSDEQLLAQTVDYVNIAAPKDGNFDASDACTALETLSFP